MKRLKTYLFLFGILFLVLGFSACKKCAKKIGDASEKNLQLGKFKSIRITGDFKIKLIQDSSFTLKISGGEGIIENVFHEIVRDTLRIENQNKCNFLSNYNKNISLEIGTGSLQKLMLTNPGSFENTDSLFSDNLVVEIRECGVHLNLVGRFNYLTLNAYTGTPTVNLYGYTNELTIDESSFGHFYAFNLEANKVDVDSRGTGFIYVTATKELIAKHSGSGIIRYKGNPAIVDTEIAENSSAQIIKD